jgi:hypothetical protein
MEGSPANPADVASIDAIVTAVYDSVSGPAGTRDWKRLRSLFIPAARLVPTTENAGEANPELAPQMLDIDGFISRCAAHIANYGFFEKEIARRTEQFGQIAHVWSTYESRHNANDPKPFLRGINSIQLFYDGTRWWIVSIYWQHESAEHPVPERYL